MTESEIVRICDFCGKTHKWVAVLIQAQLGAHICDECVDICGLMYQTHQGVRRGVGRD